MKKASLKADMANPEVDKYKRVYLRVYRSAVETMRRLDEISKQRKSYKEVFSSEAIGLRSKLRDCCEKIMFYDPVEYGRKAEELLWRKVFYDVIQLMKQNKKHVRAGSSIETAFRTHLKAAEGFYHHLLFKLQKAYQVDAKGLVDCHFLHEPKSHQKPHQKQPDVDKPVVEWATRATHRCLIYLGDLARYSQDCEGLPSIVKSERYYYQALVLCPAVGMPHNQLGTLSGSHHYSCDAAYHYMRCLLCSSTFEGAQSNLQRLMERNRKRYSELLQQDVASPRDLPPEQQRCKDIKHLMIRFMHLLDIFHNNNESIDQKDIQECCQTTLHDFNLCMFYQPVPGNHRISLSDDKVTYLSNELIFNLVIMCIMCIFRLQKAGSKLVTAAIAFTLALFSHIFNHAGVRLQSAVHDSEKTLYPIPHDSQEETGKTSDEELNYLQQTALEMMSPETKEKQDKPKSNKDETTQSQENKKNEKNLKSRNKRSALRRMRRRRGGSDDSDLSEGDGQLSGGGSDSDSTLSSDSQDDIIEYMHRNSDSDDSDNLMESQEFPPGFLGKDDQSQSDDQWPIGGGLDLNSSLNSSLNGSVNWGEGSLSSTMYDHLKDISSELFSQTGSGFLASSLGLMVPGCDGESDHLKDIVQGKKDVRVPPGFDQDPETEHVAEISKKLAEFVIETDTDTSFFTTDTENSAMTTESEKETETDSVVDRREAEEQKIKRLMDLMLDERLLVVVKVICDWMSCNDQILITCSESSQSLWYRLSVLLNMLPKRTDLIEPAVYNNNETVNAALVECINKDWAQHLAMREDLNLEHFAPLKSVQTHLNFARTHRLKMSDQEESVMRLCCLLHHGRTFTHLKDIHFTYDEDTAMFIGPVQQKTGDDDRSAQEKMAAAEARKNQLMRDMAQLRLQAEVKQLEGTLKSSDKPNLPPYLVPDASALCDALHAIKQMTNSSRFIVIIPTSVIEHLDVLKKEAQASREAIRWLEAEIHKGSRYIRVQKGHERVQRELPLKNLKKKEKSTDCDSG